MTYNVMFWDLKGSMKYEFVDTDLGVRVHLLRGKQALDFVLNRFGGLELNALFVRNHQLLNLKDHAHAFLWSRCRTPTKVEYEPQFVAGAEYRMVKNQRS